MKKWEYRITRYHLKNLSPDDEKITGTSFYCDQKGQCFLHDHSQATADMIRDTWNEEGKDGWELIQFGYHLGEMMCFWKRPVDRES